MHYDFDTPVDRSGHHAAKYEERVRVFGTDQVIPLWIADMDLPTAQPILDAVTARAREGLFGYTSRPASYFEAACAWQARRHSWSPDPALCSHALGVVPALASLVRIFSEPEDNILIQPPVYPEFAEVTDFQGRTVLANQLLETAPGHWEVDWADFEGKLQQAKLFILCSPHNPLGKVWSREELTRMMELCLQHGVLVISDEIHSDLVFRGTHIPTASLTPEIAANVITCISATKTFNLAGLHASVTVFPDQEKKRRFDQFWMSFDVHRNNVFSLVAMEAAWREGDAWLDQLLPYLDGNLHYIKAFLDEKIPEIKTFVPDATYLMWLDCRGLSMAQDDLVRFMIDRAGLGLNSGHGFDPARDGFMRLNAACPRSTLERAMAQLEAAVAAWREVQA